MNTICSYPIILLLLRILVEMKNLGSFFLFF
uniref:Uncharacterized protein n=1 Tax=Rhizophora mucronata TaxID=61149 RepID=A0A2P2QHV7_RHIMU